MMHFLAISCTLLIICTVSTAYIASNSYGVVKHKFPWRQMQGFAGKGFGSKSSGQGINVASVITESRPGTHRSLGGAYSKLLSKMSRAFEQMKAKADEHEIVDMYARLDTSDTFWFIGKVGYKRDTKCFAAIGSLEVLLLEYARTLRPVDLGGSVALGKELQLWYAPGNSEMQVAQNKVSLARYLRDGSEREINFQEVGYEPEVYQGGEEGFRCKRDSEGSCLKAAFDVNVSEISAKNNE